MSAGRAALVDARFLSPLQRTDANLRAAACSSECMSVNASYRGLTAHMQTKCIGVRSLFCAPFADSPAFRDGDRTSPRVMYLLDAGGTSARLRASAPRSSFSGANMATETT